MKFLDPTKKPKVIYTDNSFELGMSCEESTPRRSETSGIAERAIRRVKEGTSAVMLQSGLSNEWWADSKACYCDLRNIQDLLSDGNTPYERRFGMPFNGPVIPFGAMVEYHHFSASVSHDRTGRPVVCSLVSSAQQTQRHTFESEQIRTFLE